MANKKEFIFIIAAGILWGTSGIFVSLLAPLGFTSLQMTFSRGFVSLICMAAFAIISKRSAFRVKPTELLLFLGIGVSLFFTASCYFTSLQMTSVSTAVVLMYTAPIYVSVFSALFFGEKMTPIKILSVALMIVGCCLVSGIIGGMRFNLIGILIGVISGIAYAAYNIFTKAAMRRSCDPISTNVYSFLFMSAIAFCFSSPMNYFSSIAGSPGVALPLLISLGVVTFVLPYLFYTLSLKALPAGTASALSIVEPMSATVFSVILFDEPLGIASASGILLILAAVFMLGRSDGGEKGIKKKTDGIHLKS